MDDDGDNFIANDIGAETMPMILTYISKELYLPISMNNKFKCSDTSNFTPKSSKNEDKCLIKDIFYCTCSTTAQVIAFYTVDVNFFANWHIAFHFWLKYFLEL